MTGIYRRNVTATREDVDQNRHVNNLVYVRWMQDVAIEHSAARGWPMERYLAAHSGWVVRSHFIEYLQPAAEGDELTLLTWVNAMKGTNCTRRYLFWRERDRKEIVSASTVWVYVDIATGRVQRIPEELRAAFPVVDDGAARAALTAAP